MSKDHQTSRKPGAPRLRELRDFLLCAITAIDDPRSHSPEERQHLIEDLQAKADELQTAMNGDLGSHEQPGAPAGWDKVEGGESMESAIARAVTAERERCIAAVRGVDKTGRNWVAGSFWDRLTLECEERIRKGAAQSAPAESELLRAVAAYDAILDDSANGGANARAPNGALPGAPREAPELPISQE